MDACIVSSRQSDHDAAHDNVTRNAAQGIPCTWIKSHHPATKTYDLDPEGRPVKTSNPFLSQGTAHRVVLPPDRPLSALADRLERMRQNEVLVCGDLTVPNTPVPLVTQRGLPENPDAIARNKDFFQYPPGRPALFMNDHDSKDLPFDLRARLKTAGGLIAVLAAIFPDFAKAGVLLRPSSSTGIRNKANGKTTPGGSQHLYSVAKDGADIGPFVERLHEHLVMAGWGWAYISKSGHIQIRSLIDTVASGSPHWLCFEADAVLANPDLEHVPGARTSLVEHDGVFLDTAKLPELDAAQQRRRADIEAQLRAGAQPEADRRKEAHITKRTSELVAQGMPPEEARTRASRVYETGRLDPSHPILLDDGRKVTGADILRDPAAFLLATGADPLEPDYGGGRNKAIWLTNRAPIECHSFAHGGIRYTLAWTARDLIEAWVARHDVNEIERMWPLTVVDDRVADAAALAAAGVPNSFEIADDRTLMRLRSMLLKGDIAELEPMARQVADLPCRDKVARVLAAAEAEAKRFAEIFSIDQDMVPGVTAVETVRRVIAELDDADEKAFLAAANNTSSASDGQDWGEPIDIFGDFIGARRLVHDDLPDALSAFAFDAADLMGVDPGAIGLGCLVAAASVIDDAWILQPKRLDTGWTEQARLWGLLVGPPGAMKSPIIQRVTAPIDKLEASARAQHAALLALYKQAHAAWKAQKRNTPEPRPPRMTRYMIEGTTVEAISEVLRDDDEAKFTAPAKKVLCRQDELTELLANLDRYRAGGRGGGDRGAYLRLDGGGRYTVDRIQRGSFAVPNWSGCILGGIQPDPIRRIAKDAVDDGLLQRFLYFVAKDAEAGIDRVPDRAAVAGYERVITTLAGMHPAKSAALVVLDDDAHLLFEDFCKRTHAFTHLPDTSPQLRSTLNKWPGRWARMGLTYHMIEAAARLAAGRNAPVPQVLAGETARRVTCFMLDVLLPHLLQADQLMFSTEQTEHARRIAGLIVLHKEDRIGMRDIVQSYKPLRAPERKAEREGVMDALVIAGWLAPIAPRNPGVPVSSWLINPKVRARFAALGAAEAERRVKARDALEALKGKLPTRTNKHGAA